MSSRIAVHGGREGAVREFEWLLDRGLGTLRQWAATTWTDHNAHDPGVTLLEAMCYTLTDLTYRIGHPVADLLAEDERDPTACLPGKTEALGAAPLTADDWCRVAAELPGVRNAWLVPHPDPGPKLHYDESSRTLSRLREDEEPVELRGLHRMLVEQMDDADSRSVRKSVLRRLHATRPLGEDLDAAVLAPFRVGVTAAIEIDDNADPDSLLVQVLLAWARQLSPGGRASQLEGTNSGRAAGAGRARGTRRDALYTSDLRVVMDDVPGVRLVRHLQLCVAGAALEPWYHAVPADQVAALDVAGCEVALLRNGHQTHADLQAVREAYWNARAQVERPSVLDEPARSHPAAVGRPRNVGRYRSVSHEIPGLYGLAAPGEVPRDALPSRKAQVKQLQGYLDLFDHLLANMHGQLAAVADLLGFDPESELSRTYFVATMSDDRSELAAVRSGNADEHERWLDDAVEATEAERDAPSGDARRDQLLNHLLARFGERLSDVPYATAEAEKQGGTGGAKRQQLRAKARFLKGIDSVLGARGCGRNYLDPLGDRPARGFEERLAFKLGLDEASARSFYVVEHILLRPLPEDERGSSEPWELPPPPLLGNISSSDPYSLTVSVVYREARVLAGRLSGDGFARFVEETTREEVPAHLRLIVRWLDEGAWKVFEPTYREWAECHRLYWMRRWGLV